MKVIRDMAGSEGEEIVGGRRIMKNPHKGFLGGCTWCKLAVTYSPYSHVIKIAFLCKGLPIEL